MTGGARFLVRGTVQGVGFRWFVKEAAVRLELRGTVRNQPDGSVLVECWGSEKDVARLEAQLRQGPAGSRVEVVERTAVDGAGPGNFTILR